MSKEVDVESFNRGKNSGIGGNGSRDSIILRPVNVTRHVTIVAGEMFDRRAEGGPRQRMQLVAQIRLRIHREVPDSKGCNMKCVSAGNGSCIVEANHSSRELLGQQG